MPRTRWLTAALAATCLVADAPATAQPSIHWRELAVEARLESDGTLAVREDHAMVFTGEWNGGERSFWVRLGEELTIDRVSRRDAATGGWVELERGSLEVVDHWDMKNEKLRWRNRRPSDPAFDSTEIDTRLEYRLTGILRRDGDDWLLDHDFAFSDRPGEISRFVFALDLAPEWQAVGQIENRVDEGPLPTGAGRVVTARLCYVGAGVPAKAGAARLAATDAWPIVGAAGLSILWLLQWAFGRERALGRFTPLPAVDQVDRRWLDERLFVLSPEEA